jgi:hypothetical protein
MNGLKDFQNDRMAAYRQKGKSKKAKVKDEEVKAEARQSGRTHEGKWL